jgi:hypothetical protein
MKNVHPALIGVGAGAIIASLLGSVWVMPLFMLAASPGLLLCEAITKNIDSDILIFIGNWIFYTAVVTGVITIKRRFLDRRHQ